MGMWSLGDFGDFFWRVMLGPLLGYGKNGNSFEGGLNFIVCGPSFTDERIRVQILLISDFRGYPLRPSIMYG